MGSEREERIHIRNYFNVPLLIFLNGTLAKDSVLHLYYYICYSSKEKKSRKKKRNWFRRRRHSENDINSFRACFIRTVCVNQILFRTG